MASTVVKSTTNASGVAFGVAATITNALIESFSHVKSTETATVADGDGDVVAAAFYNPSETVSVSGKTNGSITATFGTALTITSGPTGSFYPTSFTESQENGGYKGFSLEAVRYVGTEA